MNNITHHVGNLFNLYKEVGEENNSTDSEVMNVIIHGCNAQGRMGSGFAKELRARFPGAYDEYKKQYESTGLQLGKNVYYLPHDENTLIVNAITQKYYGYDGKKYVSYDAIDDCMIELNTLLSGMDGNIQIHFPKIGADLGGGNWEVIKSIIETRVIFGTKHLYTLV